MALNVGVFGNVGIRCGCSLKRPGQVVDKALDDTALRNAIRHSSPCAHECWHAPITEQERHCSRCTK
jgi:hypothetical protein